MFSQSDNDLLTIKSNVEKVNLQSKNDQISILKNEVSDTLKNSEIAVFTDNSNKITLIRETYFNETGKTVIWNYIKNDEAYFIFKEYFTYKFSKNDNQYNAGKFTKTEEGFYLKNNRVIRWMQGKKVITKYPKNAASIENNMIMHVEDMINRFNRQDKR